jgi:hypothetical protein
VRARIAETKKSRPRAENKLRAMSRREVVESELADHQDEPAQQHHRTEPLIILIYYNLNVKKSQVGFCLNSVKKGVALEEVCESF